MKRSGFLMASASLAAFAPSRASADVVPGGTHAVERRADFDEASFSAAVGKAADVRQLWESVAFHPAILNNVKNALNGLQFGFGYPAERIAMVFAGHGSSSALTYSDYVWRKYAIGRAFKLSDANGSALASNVFLQPATAPDAATDADDPLSQYQDTSIVALQRRGVVFLTCHTAVEEQARTLVTGGFASAGTSATDVAADILTHLIPGAIVVPAMVAAIAVLQARYGYSYISIAFA